MTSTFKAVQRGTREALVTYEGCFSGLCKKVELLVSGQENEHGQTYFVYFAQLKTHEALMVKIGYSRNVPGRMETLFGTVGVLPGIAISLLGFVPFRCGGRLSPESLFHQAFREFHFRGEWFDLSPEVRGQIMRHCHDYRESELPAVRKKVRA